MCYLCVEFGPNTRSVIQAFRDTRTCLEPAEPYPLPVPPFAAPDLLALRKDELETRAPLSLAVLANDDDGNCEPLQLGPWQHVSNGGSAVVRPRMTAPGAPALLEYHADEPFVGEDSFWYSASDGTLTRYSNATVQLLPLEVAVHLPFDEQTGTSAADASGHGYDGALLGAPAWSEGRFGGALELDGIDDSVVLPRLDLRSNQVTITAWIYREPAQPGWAGLVYTRSGSSVAGLHFGPAPVGGATRLRYTWNADPATFQWTAPGITVPLRTWCFAALVIRPDEATIYLHDGTELRSATNHVAHAPEEFDGETHIGQDPYPGRRFRGRMDDVRIYPYALNADEVGALAVGAGPADAPFPRDGGKLVNVQDALSWVPAHGASDHALYLGTSWSAVRDATPSSPEFRGFFDPARFVPGPLAPGETYYWRVDEAPLLEPGHVWQFQRRRMHRWTLDEKHGRTAFDAEGKGNADYWGNPRSYEPGATPALGRSVRFDGESFVQADRLMDSDDFRDIDHLTLTAWVRRDGHQLEYAWVVGTSSVTLHMGPDDELRYNWPTAGLPSAWSSGLVLPDGEWAFVALVVEPTRARVYLGRDGVLASAEYHPYTGILRRPRTRATSDGTGSEGGSTTCASATRP
jgi:hypothetical protein